MADSPKDNALSPLTRNRAIAVIILAFPVLAGVLGPPLFMLLIPIALTIVIKMEQRLALPHVRTACLAGIVIFPFLAGALIQATWQGFIVLAGISGVCLLVIFYGAQIVGAFRQPMPMKVPAAARNQETPSGEASDGIPTPLIDAPGAIVGRPPLIATTTEQQTPEGTQYTITWTDYAKLQFWDRHHLLLGLPVITAILFTWSMTAWGESGKFWTAMACLSLAASVGLWLYKFYHERRRHSVRAVVIRPDGSILLQNPPAYNANEETDGPSMVVPQGLSRLTSIEYTKTAEWHWLIPQQVYTVEHWYDVHFLFGEEWRVSVSRNLGSRDHAHQVTGHLNRLRAKLTKPGTTPPVAVQRVLD